MMYQKLISFIDEPNQSEILKSHSQDKVYSGEKEHIGFCVELARLWILQTLPQFSKSSTEKSKQDIKENTMNDLLKLQNDLKQERKRKIDSTIYAYFLFFSGMLLLIKDQTDYLMQLKSFFLDEIEKETDSSARHFFGFLTVYIISLMST